MVGPLDVVDVIPSDLPQAPSLAVSDCRFGRDRHAGAGTEDRRTDTPSALKLGASPIGIIRKICVYKKSILESDPGLKHQQCIIIIMVIIATLMR